MGCHSAFPLLPNFLQIFGGAAPPKDTTAPAANGFALVAVVYTFANISGAHLNPAVTFALMCTGHMTWWKGLLYVIVQARDGGAGGNRVEAAGSGREHSCCGGWIVVGDNLADLVWGTT
jgi:hypothetical protein